MNSGKISFKNLLPQEVLDLLTEGTEEPALTLNGKNVEAYKTLITEKLKILT